MLSYRSILWYLYHLIFTYFLRFGVPVQLHFTVIIFHFESPYPCTFLAFYVKYCKSFLIDCLLLNTNKQENGFLVRRKRYDADGNRSMRLKIKKLGTGK